MTHANKVVVIAKEHEVGVIQCDGPDCEADKVVKAYAGRDWTEAEPDWYRLSLGRFEGSVALVLDACSLACLVRMAEALQGKDEKAPPPPPAADTDPSVGLREVV